MHRIRDMVLARSYIQRAIIIWETVLALFVLLGVVAGSLELVSYLRLLLQRGAALQDPYSTLQALISHVLILVVGLELAMMLIWHTPGSVIEVLMYVAARKMLGPQTTVAEFLAGTAAIGGLFAIRKYLFVARMQAGDHVFSAATPVSAVCQIADVHIPLTMGKTIGGVAARLAEEQGVDIAPSRTFRVADALIEVVTVVDGLMETVRVTRIGDDS
ncbi:MAG: hypothetical protein ACM3X3_08255 [Betaproteobacteria bacterium]